MRTASGPLMSAALRLIATGVVNPKDLEQAPPRERSPWLLDLQGALMAPEPERARELAMAP
jgi:hypothetical protein